MESIGKTFFFPWEAAVIEWLQTHLGSAGLAILSFFSMFGEELVLLLIIGIVYWGFDKRAGRTVGLTMMTGLAWNTMIKSVVMRRRPYFDNENIKALKLPEKDADPMDVVAQGWSFPSAHATNTVSLFGSLAANVKKRWFTVCVTVICLLTGLSRVTVGVHYPTDVLAGWLIGIAALILVPILEKKIENRAVRYAVLLILTAPGLFYCNSADYYTTFGLLVGFMGGIIFDDRFVDFENTKSPIRVILRTAGGLAIYLAVNTVLKLPFSKEFLESGSRAALTVRCVRYAVVSFAVFGAYPMIFKYTGRLMKKNK